MTWDTTTWAYDAATGNCLSKTYADNSTVTYTYTPDNLPLRTTYASGRWKENVYDSQRRLCGVIYSSPDMDCDLHLDEYGRTTFASNGVAQTCYALNDAGGATNETRATDNAIDTITRTFDGADRLTGLAITGQGYAQYIDYSTNGLLTSISNSDAVVAYNYSPDLKDVGYTMAFADGGTFASVAVRDPYRRDLVLSVANSCGGNTHTLEYSYDALSRPISRNADTFGYNDRSEVSSVNIGGNSETHEYDGIGNATVAAFNSETNTYSANNLNQYTTILRDSSPPRGIVHDADGNMTQCGDWSFTYDADNRLTSVSSNGIILIINQYDHKGRRVRKTTPTSVTTFLYDEWNLIYEREIAGTVTNETYYYWGKDISGSLQGAGGIGGLLYLKRNGTIYVPHRDANGNIVRYTDAAGNVVASYTYGAFGNTLSAIGALADVFHFRFSTKYYDAETGLYYYGYRFYSPLLMRWLNRDLIEEKGGQNLYGFCGNNAICRYDKYGNAHFEVRRLSALPAILNYSCFAQIIGVVPALILDFGLADKMNIEMLHEHLFYDDGGDVGYGKDGFLRRENRNEYSRRDKTEYDDCIMHEAEKLVSPPPYSLIGFGAPKFNCQDYADALRRKYNEIKDDPKIKCKCRRNK